MYTDKQISYLKDLLADQLYYFGYATHPSETNPTGFFDFENPSPQLLERHYGFRKHNEQFTAQLVRDGGWKGPKYPNNAHKDCFEFYPEQDLVKVQDPSRQWAAKKLGYSE